MKAKYLFFIKVAAIVLIIQLSSLSLGCSYFDKKDAEITYLKDVNHKITSVIQVLDDYAKSTSGFQEGANFEDEAWINSASKNLDTLSDDCNQLLTIENVPAKFTESHNVLKGDFEKLKITLEETKNAVINKDDVKLRELNVNLSDFSKDIAKYEEIFKNDINKK